MTEFKNLKKGSVLSETQFYTVEKIVGDRVQLNTESGEPVTVNKGYVESLLVSAEQYTTTQKITRTELAEMLLTNPYVAMTANFNKQVKEADVLAEIEAAYQNSTPAQRTTAWKKAIKKALNGEERTIIGRHNGHKDEFGRVQFIDMQIAKEPGAYDKRQRLVDPRTINWLVLRGVRYEAK